MDVAGKFTADIRQIGKLLRQLREETFYTRLQLAKKSGLTNFSVWAIEEFRRHPNLVTAARLCDALGYDILVVRRPGEE